MQILKPSETPGVFAFQGLADPDLRTNANHHPTRAIFRATFHPFGVEFRSHAHRGPWRIVRLYAQIVFTVDFTKFFKICLLDPA